MNIGRRVTPRVVGWTPALPGQPLPDPVLEDDRDQFPVEVVKSVLAWMDQNQAKFHYEEPTPTLISLSTVKPIRGLAQGAHRVSVLYGDGTGPKLQQLDFQASTLEFHLREKKNNAISATYRYMGVRDGQGRCIIGPRLGAQAKQRLELSLA